MTNEQAKADLAAIVDGVRDQLHTIARIQQQRSEITATGAARGKKIRVTVNADNTVIDVKFTDDIDELTYAEIAKGVVEATQRACRQVAEKTSELMAPLQMQQARLPKLKDLVQELDGLEVPGVVAASAARPDVQARKKILDGSEMPGAAEADHGRGGSVTDSSW